jgi:hypothetical protein
MKQPTTPFPERPGTLWEMRPSPATDGCTRCGKSYNSHGADELEAAKHGVPKLQRHLMCPASDEAWETYRDAVRRESADLFVEHFVSELRKLSVEMRGDVMRRILHAVPPDGWPAHSESAVA